MERTLELADGRTLNYTDWGPEDAATVFYFHGFPSSRHEFELIRPRLEQSNLPVRVIVVLVWTAVIAVCLIVAIVAIGVITGNGMPDSDAIDRLARLFVLTVLSGALAVPAAWAATLGRGLLPGITVTIGIIASAQVLIIAGAGAWYPAVAPALWAIDPTSVSIAQLGLVVIIATGFATATVHSWTRLQLDR